MNRPINQPPRFGGEMRIEEIAVELGVSRQRAAAILKKALAKIRHQLEKRNIRSVDDLIP